jgi:hypothetical protein
VNTEPPVNSPVSCRNKTKHFLSISSMSQVLKSHGSTVVDNVSAYAGVKEVLRREIQGLKV